VDFGAVTASSDDVFAVLRESRSGASLVAVNLAPVPVTCEVDRALAAQDVWNDERVDGSRLTFAPFQPRVLRLRSAQRG
jgi:hypothetical protein